MPFNQQVHTRVGIQIYITRGGCMGPFPHQLPWRSGTRLKHAWYHVICKGAAGLCPNRAGFAWGKWTGLANQWLYICTLKITARPTPLHLGPVTRQQWLLPALTHWHTRLQLHHQTCAGKPGFSNSAPSLLPQLFTHTKDVYQTTHEPLIVQDAPATPSPIVR